MFAKRMTKMIVMAFLLAGIVFAAAFAAGWDANAFNAIRAGDVETLKVALAAGLNPDGNNGNGIPLAEAVNYGQLEIVKLLVTKGANVNLQVQGLTPAAAAAQRGQVIMVDFLLDNNADKISKEQVLAILAGKGDVQRVEKLLAMGVSIEGADPEGTGLMHAAESGKLEMVKLFLSRGANPNADSTGIGISGKKTILMAALAYPEIVRMLIDKGAKVNISGGRASTSIVGMAAAKAPLETVQMLVEAGADVNIPDKRGITPLRQALDAGRTEVADYLRSVGGH